MNTHPPPHDSPWTTPFIRTRPLLTELLSDYSLRRLP
jgi:hypothetical protein